MERRKSFGGNDLGRRPRGGDVSPYLTTTYDDLKKLLFLFKIPLDNADNNGIIRA